MKVRLLNFAAIAAFATSAHAVAQEEDSLERALADLNNGMLVPQQATRNVEASGSISLNISGDARIRNTWLNPSGAGADQKNVDARLNIHFDFDVNEGANAHITFNAHENWGNPGIGPNTATGEGVPGTAPNLNAGSIMEAYYSAADLFGDGGEFSVGRRAYTFGSGRILGTDNWDQLPNTYSGLWYTHPAEGFNIEGFMITDVFNAGGVNGAFFGVGDTDLFGFQFDYETDVIEFLGTLHLNPYFLRMTTQNFAVSTTNWVGLNVTGSVEAVDYNGEIVFVDSDRNRAPNMSDFNAWALDFDIHLGEWVDDLPGDIDPVLELGIAQADSAGVTINPVYHNTAGVFDLQRRQGAPGVWGGVSDTWQAGIGLEPYEDWYARVQYIHFDDSTGTGLGDASEIDVSVSKQLNSGVAGWVGWAWVDLNSASSDAYVVYASLSLPF